MTKPMTEAERLKRRNHNEYSAWIQWRALIDAKTAEWIMQDPDMRSYIASCRAVSEDERMRRERALSREQFKRRRFEKWLGYYEAIEAQNDARG